MQRGSSEERIASANSSPRHSNKSSGSGIFGLLTKRSTKVEPHPTVEVEHNNKPAASGSNNNHMNSSQDSSSHDTSFAKCTSDKKSPLMNDVNHVVGKSKSHTLPNSVTPGDMMKDTVNIEKSQSSGIINLHRKVKTGKNKNHIHRHSTDGSQSDGGGVGASSSVVLRKAPKHRSPNHNRFSHQFSLCCKAEKKPATPPVTVRYNSIPDPAQVARRDNMSLSWTTADNASLSLNSAIMNPNCSLQPPGNGLVASANLTECASAPQSPVTGKPMTFPAVNDSYGSPSNSSLRSNLSDTPNGAVANGPIRPIAVTACRSRLRLKLYPPGKELPPFAAEFPPVEDSTASAIKRATTPQHMSSPNIATQPEPSFASQDSDSQAIRFMSHENIQMQRQGSSTGLARQALMAAQVLSLIPTEKVRER